MVGWAFRTGGADTGMAALKQTLDEDRAGEARRQDDEGAYRALRERVGALKAPRFWPAAPGKPALTLLERAGLSGWWAPFPAPAARPP